MCGTSGKNTSYESWAPAMQALGQYQNQVGDISAQNIGAMQSYNPDLNQLRNLSNTTALQNVYDTNNLQKQIDAANGTNLYGVKNDVANQIGEMATGQLTPQQSNAFLQAGVLQSLASGSDLNKGNLGASIAANEYGRNYNTYLQNQQDRALGILNNGTYATPQTGIDAGTALGLTTQAQAANVQNQNSKLANLTNLLQGQLSNANNQTQQGEQATANIASNNIAQANQTRGQNLAFLGTLASAATKFAPVPKPSGT